MLWWLEARMTRKKPEMPSFSCVAFFYEKALCKGLWLFFPTFKRISRFDVQQSNKAPLKSSHGLTPAVKEDCSHHWALSCPKWLTPAEDEWDTAASSHTAQDNTIALECIQRKLMHQTSNNNLTETVNERCLVPIIWKNESIYQTWFNSCLDFSNTIYQH